MTEEEKSPSIELLLPLGQIKGVKCQSIYGREYNSFEGIPYAQPPIGELRFRAPQPAKAWTGVKDCTKCADKPVQRSESTNAIEGSEDCLYLNVYAKKLKSDKPLPVMVYIYGGGFHIGEATRDEYSPDYFMSEDVILVTFNYRLNSLGFLSFRDPSLNIPGNAGLKDQVMALKWVKQYITHFNGDSDNITVFGESAGGASTHFMMLTDQTKGLFHKSIVMSGTAVNSFSNMPQIDMTYRLAKFNDYKGENNDEEVHDFLCKLPLNKLVDHDLLNEEEKRNDFLFSFGPIVEPYISDSCVVPKQPFELLKTAWCNDIPMMLGGTSFEGLLMYMHLKTFPQMIEGIWNEPERMLFSEVRENHTAEENREMGEKLIKLYFGDNKKAGDEALLQAMDYYSYKIFWHGFHRTALARLAYASKPTYLYRFDFDSPDFNLYRKLFCGSDPVRGVAHADELSYLFFSNMAWKLTEDSAEYKTIQRMVGIWTAFAKKSDPNCEQIKPVQWQPLTQDEPSKALNISYDIQFIELPEKPKLDVWDSLYKKENLF